MRSLVPVPADLANPAQSRQPLVVNVVYRHRLGHARTFFLPVCTAVAVAVAVAVVDAMTLLEVATERMAGEREPVEDWPRWVRDVAPGKRGYLGHSTFTTLGRSPMRFCDARAKTTIDGQDFPTLWEGELRRAYVDEALEHRRCRWSQADEDAMVARRGHFLPSYSSGVTPKEPVVGVDMRQSYWQLAQKFSTRVEYRPGSGQWAPMGAAWPWADQVGQLKVLRTVVCSRGWTARHPAMWDRGRMVELKRSSPHYQPQAWTLLSDVLMSVSVEAVALFECMRVATDEWFVPVRLAEAFELFLAERWDMTTSRKDLWTPGDPWSEHAHSNLRDIGDRQRSYLANGFVPRQRQDGPLLYLGPVGDTPSLAPLFGQVLPLPPAPSPPTPDDSPDQTPPTLNAAYWRSVKAHCRPHHLWGVGPGTPPRPTTWERNHGLDGAQPLHASLPDTPNRSCPSRHASPPRSRPPSDWEEPVDLAQLIGSLAAHLARAP